MIRSIFERIIFHQKSLNLTLIKNATLFRNQTMKSIRLIPAVAVLFMFSCSTKTRTEDIQTDLTSSSGPTNQNITVKTDYNKGLKKLKPSPQTEINKVDFLTYADEDNLELLLEENRATFVIFGMVSNDYADFEKKYGIRVKTENCVISSGISHTATLNNQLIAQHLTKKFNNVWKDDLKITPFGLN